MSGFEKDKYKFREGSKFSIVKDDLVEIREGEITILSSSLREYKILIRDLTAVDLSIGERNIILNIAFFINDNEKILGYILERKSLPRGIISKKTKIDKDLLSKWNDYIITYLLIINNEELKNIKSYLSIDNRDDEEAVENKLENIKGLLLDKSKKKAIIMTTTGDFKNVKSENELYVGEEITGKIIYGIRRFKKLFIAVGLLIILALSILGYNYLSITKVLIVEMETKIKVEINKYDRVIKISSSSEEGEKIINEIKASDKSIDWTIHSIIEQSIENDMLDSGEIFITVSGEAIDYNALQITKELAQNKEIGIVINNVGVLQTLN